MSFFSLITGNYTNSKMVGIFNETENYEKGFANHYTKYIKPDVDKFEALRINSLKTASKRLRIFLAILLFIFTASVYYIYQYKHWIGLLEPIIMIVLPISLVCYFLFIRGPIKKYSTSIKSDIFPNIISFFEDFKYIRVPNQRKKDLMNHVQKIPNAMILTKAIGFLDKIGHSFADTGPMSKKLKESGIIPSHNGVYSENFIEGKYKGIDISLFETLLVKSYGSGRNRRRKTVFKGVVILMSINKTFKGKTIIVKDRGKIGNWMKGKFSDLDNVKLEDNKFEKLFEVFSTDQIESRYLLTTSFMERLLKLQESFKGQKIECSFYNNNLLMMISVKKNLFEPGSIFKAEDFIDDCKSFLKDMNGILQIIDILKLNKNIGL